MGISHSRFGGIYIPADGSHWLTYILCDGCCELARHPATKDDILLRVELRIGATRGRA
jgi:hypothetical protein